MPAKNKKGNFRHIVKYIVFATNVFMIVLLLAARLAWTVSPLKTNLFSYIGLGFGVILLINVLYLLFWLITRKWGLALISFIALLIASKPILTFFPLHVSQKEIPENHIKVLTYNVQSFEKENKKSDSDKPLLGYIAEVDADIVCLQEYMVSKTGQSLISQRDVNRILNQYPYRSVTPLTSSSRYHIWGLAIFSKFPIENSREIVFEDSYNGAVVHSLNIDGEIFTVANIHLESNQISEQDKKLYSDFIQNAEEVNLEDVTANIRTRLGGSYRQRAKQVQKIRNNLQNLGEDNVIICGDFNDTPISYAYSYLKGDNLKDAYASTGFGPGITYHKDFFLFRIDHIFHSKSLKAFQTKVDKVKFSDHYPVYTYLSFNK